MFVYVDETGHSGKNIFDQNEIFRLGAILCENDCEEVARDLIQVFIDERGVARLHANEWPEEELVSLGHRLIEALDGGGQWRFSVTTIHKPYVSPTKFIDLIFDPRENKGAPGMWYWDEMHRHTLCVTVDTIMNRVVSKKFWESFLKDDVEGILDVIEYLQGAIDVSNEPEPVKIVFQSALKQARRRPERFTLTATEKRKGYQIHSPNLISFTHLFQEIHEFSSLVGSGPERIIHDKQDEFRSELKRVYQEFGHIVLKDNLDGRFPEAEMSKSEPADLHVTSSTDSFGLQAVDLLLWVLQRESDDPAFVELKERLSNRQEDYWISRWASERVIAFHILRMMSK